MTMKFGDRIIYGIQILQGSLMGEKYIYVKVWFNICNKYVVYILSFSSSYVHQIYS